MVVVVPVIGLVDWVVVTFAWFLLRRRDRSDGFFAVVVVRVPAVERVFVLRVMAMSLLLVVSGEAVCLRFVR